MILATPAYHFLYAQLLYTTALKELSTASFEVCCIIRRSTIQLRLISSDRFYVRSLIRRLRVVGWIMSFDTSGHFGVNSWTFLPRIHFTRISVPISNRRRSHILVHLWALKQLVLPRIWYRLISRSLIDSKGPTRLCFPPSQVFYNSARRPR